MCDLFHFIQSDYIFETMILKNMLQLWRKNQLDTVTNSLHNASRQANEYQYGIEGRKKNTKKTTRA